jgi:hypothetical protein
MLDGREAACHACIVHYVACDACTQSRFWHMNLLFLTQPGINAAVTMLTLGQDLAHNPAAQWLGRLKHMPHGNKASRRHTCMHTRPKTTTPALLQHEAASHSRCPTQRTWHGSFQHDQRPSKLPAFADSCWSVPGNHPRMHVNIHISIAPCLAGRLPACQPTGLKWGCRQHCMLCTTAKMLHAALRHPAHAAIQQPEAACQGGPQQGLHCTRYADM